MLFPRMKSNFEILGGKIVERENFTNFRKRYSMKGSIFLHGPFKKVGFIPDFESIENIVKNVLILALKSIGNIEYPS